MGFKGGVPDDYSSFDHLTAVSNVSSSPAHGMSEISQVLLAGVPDGFSQGTCTLILAPPTDWLSEFIMKVS